MVFTTYLFVFYYLPLVLLVYYTLLALGHSIGAPAERVCLVLNAFLLLVSYIFYGWWNPWFILLMLAVTVVNYLCGLVIGRTEVGPRVRFGGLTIAIVLSLGTLGFFKYFMFLETNLNHLLSWLGADAVRVLEIT